MALEALLMDTTLVEIGEKSKMEEDGGSGAAGGEGVEIPSR